MQSIEQQVPLLPEARSYRVAVLRSRTPIWLWPNLLSLDAPIVAVLWCLLLARSFQCDVSAATLAVLGLCVWAIYVADRTFDVWRDSACCWRSPRHAFHRRHWKQVLPAAFAASGAAAVLAYGHLPGALFGYGMVVAAAVAVYFVFVHMAPAPIREALPKEFTVGAVFSLGTCGPVIAGSGWDERKLAAVILFACLCWLNCAAIDAWENQTTGFGFRTASWLIAGAATLACALDPTVAAYPFYVAAAGSAMGFVWLDRQEQALSRDALRVLADATLLTPILLLFPL